MIKKRQNRFKHLLFVFFLLSSVFISYETQSGILDAGKLLDVELHFEAPLGVYFRVGQDTTFRKYDRVLSEGSMDIATHFVIYSFLFNIIRSSVASVTGRWVQSPIAAQASGTLAAFLFPRLINSLYSLFTGHRRGSEQLQIDDYEIAQRFYMELIYSQCSPHEHLRITPFPGNANTLSRQAQNASFPDSWDTLYLVATRNRIESIDLSWSQQTSGHGVVVQLLYHGRHSLTLHLPVSDSENLPGAIESQLYHQMEVRQGHAASLLNQAIIDRVIALIESPGTIQPLLSASELSSSLEFNEQGYAHRLDLCGEANDDCHWYLQLVWEPLPIPHIRPVLLGQHIVKSPLHALITQLSSLNVAEYILQLIEQEALRRAIDLIRVSSDSYTGHQESPSHFADANDHPIAPYDVPEQSQVIQSVAPSNIPTESPVDYLIKALLPERSVTEIVPKSIRSTALFKAINPLTYRFHMVDPEDYGAYAIDTSSPLSSTLRPSQEALKGLQGYFKDSEVKCNHCGGPPLFPHKRLCECDQNSMYLCQSCYRLLGASGQADCPDCKVQGDTTLWAIDESLLQVISQNMQPFLASSNLPVCSNDHCDNRLFPGFTKQNGDKVPFCMSCMTRSDSTSITGLKENPLDAHLISSNSAISPDDANGATAEQTPHEQMLKETNLKWNRVNNEFNSHGLIVRMLVKDSLRDPDSFHQAMKDFFEKKGTPQWVSASLVTPGYGTPFKPETANAGVGFAYSPEAIETKAHFKSNAFTRSKNNLETGLNSCKTPEGKKVKNHPNKRSLINKLEEKRIIHRSLRKSESETSGHFAESGEFMKGKYKSRPPNKYGLHNEVIGNFDGKAGSAAKAVVMMNRWSITELIIAVNKLIDDGADEYLPIIMHDGIGAFRQLGSLKSFREWLKKKSGLSCYFQLPEEPPEIMPDNFFDIIAGLAAGMERLEQAPETTGPDTPLDLSRETGYCNWQSYLGYFRSRFSADTLLPNLMNSECFADNISRFIELLTFYYQTKHSLEAQRTNDLDRSILLLGNELRGVLVRSVLVSSAYRQLLESEGIEFDDNETILISFAAIYHAFRCHHSMDYPSPEQFTYFIKSAPAGLRDNIQKALLYPDKVFDINERHTLYAHILSAVKTLRPEAEGINYKLWSTLKKLIRQEDEGAISNWVSAIKDLPTRWNYHAPIEWSKGTMRERMYQNTLRPFNEIASERINWIRVLRRVKEDISRKMAKTLRTRSEIFAPWPYTEQNLMIPQMSLLELIYISASTEESWLFDYLANHYLAHGVPRLTGTIDNSQVTQALVKTLKNEEMIISSFDTLGDTLRLLPNIKLRPHEIALPLGSDFSIYQNLKVSDASPSALVEARGRIDYVRIDGPGADLAKSIYQFQPVYSTTEPFEECPVCFDNTADNQDCQFLKTPCCSQKIHKSCLSRALTTSSGNCPMCRQHLVDRQGPQPSGSLIWKSIRHSCFQNECYDRFFEIDYSTPAGQYREPGQEAAVDYVKDYRKAFIPDTEKGRKAFYMLLNAYKRGFVLSFGTSLSRQLDNVVIWGDPPQKSKIHGSGNPTDGYYYPDPDYLDRLIDTLKVMGISEPPPEMQPRLLSGPQPSGGTN